MRQMIKNECKRSIFSRGMLCSLILGLGIVLWFEYSVILGKTMGFSGNDWCPDSLFYKWIGACEFPVQSFLFFFVIPLLAVLPGGASLHEDMKSGYIQSVILRSSRKKYLLSKYIGVFISGGIAVVLPLLVSLFITAMKYPALKPEPIVICLYPYSMLNHMFYTHPGLFLAILLILDFLMSGAIATVSLLFSFFTNHKVITLIIPFVLCYCVYCFQGFIDSRILFSPNFFMMPQEDPIVWEEFFVSFIILGFLGFLYGRLGKHYE